MIFTEFNQIPKKGTELIRQNDHIFTGVGEPFGGYDLIYADPAWSYRDKATAGNRGAECKYQCMSVEDLMALPVKDIASDNSLLAMWVTYPQLPSAIPTMTAWGFTYKTVGFVWVKTAKSSEGLFWGMGRWTRSNPEMLLLGTRGKPLRASASVHSVILEPNREHSRKPDTARDRLVQLCGDVPRIELFSRTQTSGWDAWGNEVCKF